MKTLINFKTLLVLVSVALLSSCMNMNDPEMSSSFTAISDDGLSTAVSENAVISADASINSFMKSAGVQKAKSSDPDSLEDLEPTVTRLTEKGEYPAEYVVDYGEKGYKTRTNHVLKGKVHYTVSDITCKRKDYKFSNFSIDGKAVEFSKSVEVLEKGKLRFITEETQKSTNNGHDIYKHAERTRTKISSSVGVLVGDGDNDEDDYTEYDYSIEVKITGINAKGESYTLQSVEPMITDHNKKGLTKGIMRVTTKKGTKHLDYSKEGNNKEVEYKEKESDNKDSENHSYNSENNNSDNSNKSNDNSNSDNSNKSNGK